MLIGMLLVGAATIIKQRPRWLSVATAKIAAFYNMVAKKSGE